MSALLQVTLTINGVEKQLSTSPKESLLSALRGCKYRSVKMGCDSGDCGVCTVLLDGRPVRSCMTRTSAVDGCTITTVEGLEQSDPVMQAFMDVGAIQCGYCTPAQVLVAKALLDSNPDPSETTVREAMSGVLCRCTGYVRVVDAVLRAAARLRGEAVEPFTHLDMILPDDKVELPAAYYRRGEGDGPLPPLVFTPAEMEKTWVVGQPQVKVDAEKLVHGRPVFTADVQPEGMLYGLLLTSPHAHARIRRIDASRARALPGVHAVLTCHDIPRVKYASGGQSYPQPPPYDQVCLDDKVRHVGDRVAVVAAETPELARRALRLIKVEYEVLPAVVDPEEAMREGAPVIHDEPDTQGICDPRRNVVHHIEAEVGDVEAGLAAAEQVFEGTYRTPKQHTPTWSRTPASPTGTRTSGWSSVRAPRCPSTSGAWWPR